MARVTAGAPRPATDADAILDIRPDVVYEPASVEEAIEIVRSAFGQKKSLAFVGGGTDLELGAPPERLDAVVRTAALRRVVEYAPSDQIVVAEAGMTLESLQERLAAHGQRLSIDPPLASRATLGGIVAANAFGPRRARFGSVRDLIIGVSLVRADGTLARSGGKVVKNVAGFDLPKLLVGSLGTLGLIASVTFRLHPLPEASATLRLAGQTARQVRLLVSGMREAQLEPTAVAAVWRGAAGFDVAVRFEGFGAGVAQQVARFQTLAGFQERGEVLGAAAESAFWSAHDAARTTSPLVARLAAPLASIETLAAESLPELLGALESPAFLWYPTLGLGFVSGAPASLEAAATAVGSARASLPAGGTLVLARAPAGVRRLVDVWGPPPPALDLMRSVKERFDPGRRLSPGRFVGGI
ncbi:MAG TPA: FAD-binding oxidoreductase [Thermoanaerobaculia bacterium]|nr:FAD-binding oxidoreductase [Thermoanaerobaculia bacterium]